MKFYDVSWRINFSIFNKNEKKKYFFCSIGVSYLWNEVIMHLTVKLLMQIPGFKSKLGANIPLIRKNAFFLK